MSISSPFFSTFRRFPCALISIVWIAFSLQAIVAAKESSLFIEKSLVLGIIGLPLFILLQLVAENRFSTKTAGIWLQCAGWPLLFLLWPSFPALPFEHWDYGLYFKYSSLTLTLILAITLIPYFFRYKDRLLWELTRIFLGRLLKALVFGGLIYAGLSFIFF